MNTFVIVCDLIPSISQTDTKTEDTALNAFLWKYSKNIEHKQTYYYGENCIPLGESIFFKATNMHTIVTQPGICTEVLLWLTGRNNRKPTFNHIGKQTKKSHNPYYLLIMPEPIGRYSPVFKNSY